ncbi:MAG: tetratricopeptide repeat protein [Ignavibacteriales bacterium]|nr:tetratricopeptide repeat protein [Ignavibacteriales bacterium]
MANVRSIRAILFSLVLILSFSQSGCSVFDTLGGWISHGYDNTVSYFNAYYNAKTLFDEAEAEVLAARSAMKSKPAAPFAPSSGYPGSSSYPGAPGSPGSSGFPNSQGFPSSSGLPSSPGVSSTQTPQTYQSPVAQQTSSSSKQKFAAVIDKCSHILSFYPTSSVVGDALFLIGKSYFYQDDFLRAERKFTELVVQDPNGPLSLSAQLWLLKTLQRLARFDDANRVGNELVDAATKGEKLEIAGEALEILGDVAASQTKPEAAIELYAKAVAITENGPIRAAAQARIGDLYFSGEQYDKAASAYLEVAKYSPEPYAFYSSELQAAIAYRRIGQYDAAIETLRRLEADYRFMDFFGTIRFELASTFAANHKFDEAVDLFRLVDTSYARTEQGAKAAFDLGRLLQFQMGDYANAKIAYTHATVGGPQDLTQEAQRRASALDKYFKLSDQFMKLDSIYFILDVDSMWTKVDSSAVGAKKGIADTSVGAPRKDTLSVSIDSVARRQDKVGVMSASDTTSLKKSADLTDRPAVPSRTIVSRPRKDSLVASLGNVSYQLGELFYTDLDVPDSTFMWLNQALKLGVDSVRSVRALFVLAVVTRANPDKKYGNEKDFYRQIVAKYPKSAYAEEARIALGFPPTPKKVDPAAAMFAVAESLMYAGKYQPAVDSLSRIVKDYPESPMTPKSRYTMAWIYEQNLAIPDSALSQYKLLAAKHANTKYGEAAQRRIPPVVADTTKKAAVDPTKKPAADTTAKPPSAGLTKVAPDTTVKFPTKTPVPADSLFRKDDPDDDRPARRGVPGDTTTVRRRK